MDVQVRVVGDDASEDQASLWHWLHDVDGLQGHVRKIPGPLEETQLGGGLEAIGVGLGSSGASIAFTRCVVAWLRARHPTVKLKVVVTAGETTVEIDGADAEAARTLLQEALGPRDDD